MSATATPSVRKEVIQLLDMKGCEFVHVTPDRPNIHYEVRKRTDNETDCKPLMMCWWLKVTMQSELLFIVDR